jgi:TetR/AcrR family transcriptional repressor of nem operon
MAGRPRQYEDEEVIAKATSVFRDKPYDAASADELLEAMGIGKSSFYLNFKGGKKELFERTLKQFGDKVLQDLEHHLSNSGDPVSVLKDFFLTFIKSTADNRNRGCYIGNALMQFSITDTQTSKQAAAQLGRLHQLFAKAIRRAQQQGTISVSQSPGLLAWHLITLWNGINVTARAQQSQKVLRDLVGLGFSIIA